MPVPYKVMLADDDPAIVRAVDAWLKKAGYAVIQCHSGMEFLGKVAKSQPDIVLMDVMLGDADGRQLCQRLRESPATRHIPVVLISGARTAEGDMVRGLQGGADDYLPKPLKPRLLLAKIEAVLRRLRSPKEPQEALRYHGLVLNIYERTVRIHGRDIHLSSKEFELLTVLLRKVGKVLSPQYLLETVWGYELEDYNDPHTVQVHISRLKKKLGRRLASRIRNLIGAGYRLIR